ncbi:hypothetical protein LMG7974_00983 [Campylobacter majalis]|uniref:4Fe-4S ferredoxin-type domain-containing protein n=1 Tax=Campylobacter majalis TaxID=2790656 RepID=A0ABM8Q682_9BACT|nr:cytochrome c oxidase accessory protein CcoG [Campylobacter majalis]CAD7288385.1 hypothetical protein LMG7974_00983 [Campylobacter majalis]
MFVARRYISFFIITCIAITLPFLRINDTHLFLLSFDKLELHLFFTRFDMQELYLMPFVFIILFLFIFFITTLGGRIWCGWACPQTLFRVVYRDLLCTKILGIYKSTKNKQTSGENVFLKLVSIIIWTAISALIASNFMWYFIPPEDFFNYIKNPAEHKLLIGILTFITTWLVFDIVYLKEKFCVYICPYARIQSTMFDTDTIQVIYDEKRGGKIYNANEKLPRHKPSSDALCTNCEACVKICPTHIDIRKGMQLDCINCLDCVDACTQVMAKFNQPPLISWTSNKALITNTKVKYARFRTIAYCIVLFIAISALFLMSGKKEHMLLNINRTTQLYSVTKSNEVENYYVFLFQNTDKKEHSYYFEVLDSNISIVSPTTPIVIKPGAKQRVVVTLKSHSLNLNDTKDTPINIKVNAFATDEKEKINVKRDTIFIYPKKL